MASDIWDSGKREESLGRGPAGSGVFDGGRVASCSARKALPRAAVAAEPAGEGMDCADIAHKQVRINNKLPYNRFSDYAAAAGRTAC